MDYMCYACGRTVGDEETVWINPSNGQASVYFGEAFHVECAPDEYASSLPYAGEWP